MSQADTLKGKVALVTGASRGIGEAIALELARKGAKVAIASRKEDGLRRVAELITYEGADAFAATCNTGKLPEVDALLKNVLGRFGQIDVLVNNAATNPYFGPMISLDWGAWDKTFEVNLKGYFALSQAVAKHLIDRKSGGSIINVASVLGTMAAPMQGIYGMTKAAVISLTKTLAMELGSAGIRVNALAPGLVDTKFASVLVQNDQIRDMIVQRTAIGRVGVPNDIAGAAAFLASDASAYITGQTLIIDGGWTIS